MYYIFALHSAFFIPGLCFSAIDKIIDKFEKTFKSSQRTVDYLHCKNLQFLKSYFELFNYRAEPTL